MEFRRVLFRSAVRCGSPPSGPCDPAHQAAAEALGHRQYAMLEEGGEDQHAAPRRESHARLLKAEKFEGAALIFIRVGQLHHDRQLAIEGTGGFQPHILMPVLLDRKSTRLNSSHYCASRMTSSA